MPAGLRPSEPWMCSLTKSLSDTSKLFILQMSMGPDFSTLFWNAMINVPRPPRSVKKDVKKGPNYLLY